jgi:hypothetical protein
MRGPAFEQRGSGKSEFVEERAQIEPFLGLEWEIPPWATEPTGRE